MRNLASLRMSQSEPLLHSSITIHNLVFCQLCVFLFLQKSAIMFRRLDCRQNLKFLFNEWMDVKFYLFICLMFWRTFLKNQKKSLSDCFFEHFDGHVVLQHHVGVLASVQAISCQHARRSTSAQLFQKLKGFFFFFFFFFCFFFFFFLLCLKRNL